MTTPFETSADIENHILTTDLGRRLLEQVADVAAPGPADLVRWRAIAPMEWVHAAIRLQDCRRRAATKYSRAGSMWLDPVGLEQATAEVVARLVAQQPLAEFVIDHPMHFGARRSIRHVHTNAVPLFEPAAVEVLFHRERGRQQADLVDAGKIRTTVSESYGKINAENLRRAHRQIESHSTIGKIVLEGF